MESGGKAVRRSGLGCCPPRSAGQPLSPSADNPAPIKKPPGEGRLSYCRSERKAQASSAGASSARSEEHTSELQSLMRISYAVFCLKKKNNNKNKTIQTQSKTTN